MIKKLKHLPVHWIDGMKINKNHFTDMQNFVSDSVRDSIGIHTSPIDYGLLPVHDSIKTSLIVDHEFLKITIEGCHAITPDGSRIDIGAQNENGAEFLISYPEAIYEIKGDEKINLLACLSVSLFHRTPYSEPDPDEHPPRYPYTQPGYSLELIPEHDIKSNLGFGGGYLTVARISVNGGEIVMDSEYVPPCLCVSSHKKLKELYTDINSFYGQIEFFVLQIKQRIRMKKQSNLLALMVEDMADKTIGYLGMEIDRYRCFAPYSSPIYMLSSIIALARVLNNCIETYRESGKEELLNYLTEWCNISQGDFESIFTDLLNMTYNHNQTNLLIVKVRRFIKTVEEMYSILNQLDYIGKRRDGSIFISESTGNKESVIHPKRNQSFLAD